MKENVVFDSAKKAGTFVGKTLVCFASGIMLVADAASRSRRNYTTGNVNVTVTTAGAPQAAPVAPAYVAGKRSRFVCRQCGAPVAVKSFRLARGYTPGKGFLCDSCMAQKNGLSYEAYANGGASVSVHCADCGKELKAKSFHLLRKYRIGKNYYCRDCYRDHEDD